MSDLVGLRIHITGIVQGVGFRPFVYGLAKRLNLKGWVRNTSAGVDIEVDGSTTALEEFVHSLKTNPPPLAKIDTIRVDPSPFNGFTSFEIIHSEPIPGAYIPISPDVSICNECLVEMMDPLNRRYLYPFINCTHCGPRFTIIKDIPYDRPKTTMAPFEMCPECFAEYEDPLDRRFHAQPVACARCGPHVWLEKRGENQITSHRWDAIKDAQRLLCAGKIVAIKGLGGFHLACDATNLEAVSRLRDRKLRVDKPFALMMPDIDTIEMYCDLNKKERELLLSRERPIVLLRRKPGSKIALSVAPNQETLGVMLPYTPLHHLIYHIDQTNLDEESRDTKSKIPPLVMTSGNLIEEPIAITNSDARIRLSSLADAFLMHNRDIHTRCDDSVLRNVEKSSTIYHLRRSRGYAPNPIKLPWKVPQILASGAELKNTFCLTKDDNAFISHHIGDMENYETLQSFQEGIIHFENLFRVSPEAYACDLHPDYLATRYILNQAESTGFPVYQIQHHHAHICACMVDNGLGNDRPVIGISFDGTGYGDDHAIWGGEFLIVDYHGYQRFAHLKYAPLPGGDAAIKKPYRVALAQLWQNGIPWDDDLYPVMAACGDDLSMLKGMLENKINTPMTSSMGRLFDAVAALGGVRSEVNYEAQAAIELEALVDPYEKQYYSMDIKRHESERGIPDTNLISLDPYPMLNAVIKDLRSDVSVPTIAAKFHNGLAHAIVEVCEAARKQFNMNVVALSGGVWQNMILLARTMSELEHAGFTVYIHRQVPTNDGGLALGQAVIAAYNHQNLLRFT